MLVVEARAGSQSKNGPASALRPRVEAAVKARMRLLTDEELLLSKRRGAAWSTEHDTPSLPWRTGRQVGESREIRANRGARVFVRSSAGGPNPPAVDPQASASSSTSRSRTCLPLRSTPGECT